MTPKKPYSPPKIFQVDLNQEQAVLAICSASYANNTAGTRRKCAASGCRRAASSGDNTGTSS